MNIQVNVVTYKSWSDSSGYRHETNRPAIMVKFKDEDKMKFIPIMSNDQSIFHKTESFYSVDANKFGIKANSWLAWGFERDYDKTLVSKVLRKKVMVNLDELTKLRANYHTNGGQVCKA